MINSSVVVPAETRTLVAVSQTRGVQYVAALHHFFLVRGKASVLVHYGGQENVSFVGGSASGRSRMVRNIILLSFFLLR